MAKKDHSTKFYCYAHRTADTNHVFYIGKGHGNRAYSIRQRSKYWHNKANKHGYTVEIIATGLTERQAFDMEREFIAFYGRDRLVNLTDGGEGSAGWIPSNEFKLNVSITQTGMKRSEETKAKLSLIAKNRTKEHINKIANALRGVKRPNNSGDNNSMRRKEVIEKRSGENHHFYGKKRHDMSGENHFFFGKKRPEISGANHFNARSVVCIDTNELFASMSLAIKWLKTIGFEKATQSNIGEACKGKRKKAYGHKWKYAE